MQKWRNICMIGYYIIDILWIHQYHITSQRFLLMVKLINKSLLGFYCKCHYENFTIAWWVHCKRVVLNRREKENNFIISDSALWSILPPQLKKISAHYKVMCECKCYILLSQQTKISKLKYPKQNIRWISTFYLKKKSVMMHGSIIYKTAVKIYIA